jgi:hypothetical protein
MLALGHMVLGDLGLLSFKLIVNWNVLQVAILANEPICLDRKRNDIENRQIQAVQQMTEQMKGSKCWNPSN